MVNTKISLYPELLQRLQSIYAGSRLGGGWRGRWYGNRGDIVGTWYNITSVSGIDSSGNLVYGYIDGYKGFETIFNNSNKYSDVNFRLGDRYDDDITNDTLKPLLKER